LFGIAEARSAFSSFLSMDLAAERFDRGYLDRLVACLEPHRGEGLPVQVNYSREDARATLLLGEGWRVSVSDDLMLQLQRLYGKDRVRVVYS
jgi:DNA polymerase-3 subunit alpha